MTAVLFGSISSLADTSELQRQAFNDAFAQHGLGWTWDREEYQQLLRSNGGRDRIADYAEQRGETVDADAVHATKSELFQASLGNGSVKLRDGVAETIVGAKEAGHLVGLVTTTSPENVRALLSAVKKDLPEDAFDLVLDKTDLENTKPDPAAYERALSELGESPETCVAVEDNPGGVEAAVNAGIACVAFPNENTMDHDFPGARATVDTIELGALLALVRA